MLSRFDSFARLAQRLAEGFAALGWRVDRRLLTGGGGGLSARHYREIGLPEDTPRVSVPGLFRSGELAGYAAVFLGATGGTIRSFLRRMADRFPDGKTPRPLVLTGYPGVILRDRLSGFTTRCGADFVLLNAPSDLADWRRFCLAQGLDPGGGRLFGYPFPPFRARPVWPPRKVLFAEQAVIPRTFRDRLYVLERLADYARAHPDREVVLKPRLVPGEQGIFSTSFHMECLLPLLRRRPPNLRLSYGDIQDLLRDCDLCLTLSSTVALQAMRWGIPAGIIRDFGFRDEFGTAFFSGSGCLLSFEELIGDSRPLLDGGWFAANFSDCAEQMSALSEAVAGERARRRHGGDWSFNGNFSRVYARTYPAFLDGWRCGPGVCLRFALASLAVGLKRRLSRLTDRTGRTAARENT